MKSKNIYWSKGLFDLFERTEEIAPSYEDFLGYIEKDYSKKLDQIVQKCIKDHEPYYVEYPLKVCAKWIAAKGVALTDKNGNVTKLLGTVSDITDIKTKQLRLKNTSTLVNQHCLISECDKNGTITFANDLFCEISGYSKKDLLGKPHSIINSGIHSKEFWKQVWNTIQSGKTWQGVLQNKKKNGEYYWVRSTILPVINSKGSVDRYISYRTDITAFKETEQLRDDLEKTTRAALIGEAATGIAHELNQPLSSISSSADLIIRKIRFHFKDIPEDIEQSLRRLEDDTVNAGNLVHSIKNLYAKRKTDISQINLEKRMKALQIEEESSSSSISYTISKDLKEKEFYFSPTYLTLIFKNLIDNSKDAFIERSEELNIRFEWFLKNEFICLDYKDNGPGISLEIRDKIFQHFFSTRKDGTGIGLSFIYTLLEFYGGSIKSLKCSKGAHFQVLFSDEKKFIKTIRD